MSAIIYLSSFRNHLSFVLDTTTVEGFCLEAEVEEVDDDSDSVKVLVDQIQVGWEFPYV